MTTPSIVFAGTPDFAVASLRALVDAGDVPVAVYTQPDRPAGRGKRVVASPVKQFANKRGIDVYQPATLKDDDAIEALRALQPDVLIVAAYGLLLPQAVLEVPTHGCINVHASLLPRWRGAAPIQAAILAGDEETGVCLMQMEAGLDTGPVFVSDRIPIDNQETAGELHDRLALAGGALLVDHLASIIDGSLEAAPQDDRVATHAAKIRTADAAIDWYQPAKEIARHVRAFNPVPGAYFMLGDERIKCWQATAGEDLGASPGTVCAASRDGIVVACGVGSLSMQQLQRPGKRPVTAAEFANQRDIVGHQL
ncbi:MAG: methionyl-tRNA formyltransferase [Pseudomonadota bacterium]